MDGYMLYLPRNYQSDRSYPVIIFLQGGKGVGGPVQQVVSWGLPKLLIDEQLKFKGSYLMQDSFIVVCPHMIQGSLQGKAVVSPGGGNE